MRRFLTAVALTVVAALALTGAKASAAAQPTGTNITPDGDCADYWIDCGYTDNEVWTDWQNFGPGWGCRYVHARATRHNLAGFVVFRYQEQVYWCWNGYSITQFWRDRWPSDVNFSWSWDGHVWTDCGPYDAEHCSGKTGVWGATASTKGQFHVCIAWWLCKTKFPTLSLSVYGNGAWSGAAYGA
jgi:hypothetical protein